MLDKPKINEIARDKLNSNFANDFEAFLNFLKQEKITTPWRGILRAQPHIIRFYMKHKGKDVGHIDFNDDIANYIDIQVITVGWLKNDFDVYLEGQPNEIFDMLTERLSQKCIHCNTNHANCSPGRSAEVAGKQYEKICVAMTLYKFGGDNMQELTLHRPQYIATKPVGLVPLEMIKKLILARRDYIAKAIENKFYN
ncbi:MAG: hypothetical protein FWE06_09705 [Oscillospiraceae bacterium]|nr:hypothetical protein [Oscillospiraceae bacterium]